jgi:Family of unknown function (DUF5996)
MTWERTLEDVAAASLPPLPFDEWEPTKQTLHRYCQLLGKVKLASTQPRNHWWNVSLSVSARGLTTRLMRSGPVAFELELDFVDHALVARTDRGEVERFVLEDGLSVAGFSTRLFALLAGLGIRPEIRPEPFGISSRTPLTEDDEHASYDAEAVTRFWRILLWVDGVLDEFAGRFAGKQSPVHLFWHSLDLALSRFSGRRAEPRPGADSVTREAYASEVISFGFWPGDEQVREPAFYTYTWPEPASLRDRSLRPEGAKWTGEPGASLGRLSYEVVRTADAPRDTLLEFLESGYRAGAQAAGWDVDALASSWATGSARPVPA